MLKNQPKDRVKNKAQKIPEPPQEKSEVMSNGREVSVDFISKKAF